MSFHDNNISTRNVDDLNTLVLSRYGFGFKLASFTTVLGWIGMLFSVTSGVGALILIAGIIDISWACPYVSWYCGLWSIVAAVTLLASPVWFYLSFQLRRQSEKKSNLDSLTRTLKIICYIQAALSILVSGPLLVFPILSIIGIARRRTQLIKIYIIYNIAIFLLVPLYILADRAYFLSFGNIIPVSWHVVVALVTVILFLLIVPIIILVFNPCQYNKVYIFIMFNIIVLAVASYWMYKNISWYEIRGLGSLRLYGVLGCLTPLLYSYLLYFYHNGFIISLHTIFEHNENEKYAT